MCYYIMILINVYIYNLNIWYLMDVWCVKWLTDKMEVWSRHNILKKKKYCVKIVMNGYLFARLCEIDNPNSNSILESYKWKVSGGDSRERFK